MVCICRARVYPTVLPMSIGLTVSVAYLAFIIDSQHALIFGDSPILHAQELNIKLPCKNDLWEAPTPIEWLRVTKPHNTDDPHIPEGPGFFDILKLFMDESGTVKETVRLDPFRSFVVLHGIFNLQQHLQQMVLGFVGSPPI